MKSPLFKVVLASVVAFSAPAFAAPRPANDISSWFGPDDLPLPPVRPEWADGRLIQIMLALEVDEMGNLRSCTPVFLSGFAMIDKTACRVVEGRARFAPGYPGVHVLPIKLMAG